MTEIVKSLFATLGDESLSRMLNEKVPLVVGVPEIIPVEESRARPGGSEPTTVQVKGAVAPPPATSCSLYSCWPWVQGLREVFRMLMDVTNMERDLVTVAAVGDELSVTETVKGKVPLAEELMVPLMMPVPEFSDRPGGKAPEVTVQFL